MATAKEVWAALNEEQRKELLVEAGVDNKPGLSAEDVQKMLDARDAKAAEDKRLADEASEKARIDAEKKAWDEEQAKGHKPKSPGIDPDTEETPTTVKGFYGGLRPERRYDAKSLFELTPDEAEECGSNKTAQEAWHKASDDLLILDACMRHGGRAFNIRQSKLYQSVWGEKSALRRTVEKALYSTGAGVGDEWVPTVMSPTWMEKIHAEGEVAPIFPRLSMPSNPTLYPIFSGRTATAYLQGEATSDESAKYTASNVTSDQLSVSAKKLAVRVLWSEEFEEDAITSAMEYVRRDITNSIAFYVDRAIMDGDATGGASSHFDTGHTLTDSDVRVAFDGIRRWPLDIATGANKTCSGITWSCANQLLGAISAAGQYLGPNPVGFCSRSFAPKLSLLENRGGYLVNSPGGAERAAVGSPGLTLFGNRVIPTDHILDTYNASGVYDASTTSYTEFLWVNPSVFYIATKRDWSLEVEKDIATGQWQLVMTCRMGFDTPYADTATTSYIASVAYCILTSW